MNEALRQESEKLLRSWMQHESSWLREYLVSGVEDPRISVQSIVARHLVVRALAGDRFSELMQQEYRFAAVMNWLLPLVHKAADQEELEAVLFGLRRGADNVEGIELPAWARRIFATLPMEISGVTIPNYVEGVLGSCKLADGHMVSDPENLETFCRAWNAALGGSQIAPQVPRISVLEPACGSANDYRFLAAYGIASLINYTGFDLCARNIENARALFPSVRFEVANVFEIPARDQSFDFCVVHDLFEHLSLEGLEAAINEVCRITRQGMCLGFFQADEVAEHVVRPVDEYHWNLLSVLQLKAAFARCGFAAQVLHIGTFLRESTGCERTHNPNAYTFMLERT